MLNATKKEIRSPHQQKERKKKKYKMIIKYVKNLILGGATGISFLIHNWLS
jgi:hypothetical protein